MKLRTVYKAIKISPPRGVHLSNDAMIQMRNDMKPLPAPRRFPPCYEYSIIICTVCVAVGITCHQSWQQGHPHPYIQI